MSVYYAEVDPRSIWRDGLKKWLAAIDNTMADILLDEIGVWDVLALHTPKHIELHEEDDTEFAGEFVDAVVCSHCFGLGDGTVNEDMHFPCPTLKALGLPSMEVQ